MLWLWHCRLGAGLKGRGGRWHGKGGGGGGKKGEVVAIMQNGCHGRPRRGLFSLSRATDEPQMDGQLLWVSEPGEVGVTRGVMCVF